MKTIYIVFLFSFVAIVGIASIYFFGSSGSSYSTESCSDQFYRPSKDLEADGVKIISLDLTDENTLHNKIREYFITDYRETLKHDYEKQVSSTKDTSEKAKLTHSLEVLDQVLIAPPEFSNPRSYNDLGDGFIGVIASSQVYVPDEDYVRGVTEVFFFRTDDSGFELMEHFPIGEDHANYEVSPVRKFKESLD